MGETEERFGAKGFNGSWKRVKEEEELEPQRARVPPARCGTGAETLAPLPQPPAGPLTTTFPR